MSEFRCYCGAEVPTWFPNEGDRQYWHEKHAKCKQAPAPPADREREWLDKWCIERYGHKVGAFGSKVAAEAITGEGEESPK